MKGLAVAVALALALLAATPCAATRLEPVERPDDQLLVLELLLDRFLLRDALLAYHDGEHLLLPLGEVASALALAVEVDLGEGSAEGWILREGRVFSLDSVRREVLVDGRRERLAEEDLVELHVDDLYVEARLLERWLPIAFEVDLLASRVLVHSREPLPLERRLERRRLWRQVGTAPSEASGALYRREAMPYRLVDWPAVDHQMVMSLRSDERGARTSMRSNLLAAGDLFHLESELAVAWTGGDGASPPEARLKLGRRDPDAALLGGLRATEVSFGDLLTPGRPLVSQESWARGVRISNFPLDRPEEFDRITLRGDLPAGWEVELYHNEELRDFQVVGEDGRYELVDVPLYVGLNLLRLVFHGPQGQVRERRERYLIGPDMIRRDEGYYRVALQEQRFFAEYERGLRRGLSLSSRIESLPVEGERHTYVGVGLPMAAGGVLGRVDLAADVEGGWAGRLSAEGALNARLRFRVDEEFFDGLVSEEAGDEDPLRRRGRWRLDGRFFGGGRRPLKLALAAAFRRRLSGAAETTWTSSLSTRLGRISLSHGLEHGERRLVRGGPTSRSLSSSILAAGRFGSVRARAGMLFDWRAGSLTQISVTVDQRWSESLSSRFQVRHGLDPGDLEEDSQEAPAVPVAVPDAVSAGLDWHLRRVTLGLSAGWEGGGALEHDRLRMAFSMSYSLRRNPLSRRLRMSSRPSATQGAVAARVFLDHDLDGRYGAGDEPLPGVRFRTGGGGRPDATDEDGVVLLSGLEAHRPVDVGLKIASLEDPFWVLSREGVAVVPRAGRVMAVDFPVFLSGEVDGTVWIERGGREIGVAKVAVELVDPRGAVTARTTSAYDGFYLLEKVPPGHYRLRLDAAELGRLGVPPPPEREVEIGADGTVRSGLDFHLGKLPDVR